MSDARDPEPAGGWPVSSAGGPPVSSAGGSPVSPAGVQQALARFVRAFGLHQPERTPCGQPMPVSEAHALTELRGAGALRQVDLGRRLRLEKSTVSRLVGQLVRRGWVDRDPARDDGRGVLLRLTASGRDAADRVADARAERFARLLDRIPPARRAEVLRALHTLAEAADDQS